MAIIPKPCYVIACDECREELRNHFATVEGWVMHFESGDNAESEAEDSDWVKLPDGRNICQICVDPMAKARKIVRDDKGEWMILP